MLSEIHQDKDFLLTFLLSIVIFVFLFFLIPDLESYNNDLIPNLDFGETVDEVNPIKHRIGLKRPLIVLSDIWYPYCGREFSKNEGIIIEILKKIFEPYGYYIIYKNKPWSRCIEEVNSGEAHILAGCDSSEVPKLAFPETPIALSNTAFFTRSDSKINTISIEQLATIRLGAIQNYNYYSELDNYIDNTADSGKVFFSKGESPLEGLIMGLLSNRIDVLVEEEIVFNASIKQMALSKIEFKKIPGEKANTPIFIAFSETQDSLKLLLKLYEKGLLELKKKGEYDALFHKYLN